MLVPGEQQKDSAIHIRVSTGEIFFLMKGQIFTASEEEMGHLIARRYSKPGRNPWSWAHLCTTCASLKQCFPEHISLTTCINHLQILTNSDVPGPHPSPSELESQGGVGEGPEF